MAKFRKKPVVIDAWQVPPPCNDKNIEDHGWLAACLQIAAPNAVWIVMNGKGEIEIETLEGNMVARNGDWIIRGVAGELYPCKPDIFAATYEPVTA